MDLRILKKLTHFSLTINGTYNDQPPVIQFPDEFSVNFKLYIPEIKWNMGENQIMNLVQGVRKCEAKLCLILVDNIRCLDDKDIKLFMLKFADEYSKQPAGH